MKLSRLVETSHALTATRSRKAKSAALAALVAETPPALVPAVVAAMIGEVRAGKIGVGPALARKARKESLAASAPSLTLEEVEETFARIAQLSGAGSARAKEEALGGLFSRATEDEQLFLARLLLGELRQGALEGLMVEGLAEAFDLQPARVRRAVMLAGDLTEVAEALAREGERGLDRFRLELFRPLQPMLASPADDLEAAFERLGEAAAFEAKLDGARIQLHKRDDEVRVFTRHLKEVTPALPEVVELARALPARTAILDGEVIALREDGRPHPFQVTMRRFGRKLDVDEQRRRLPLTTYLFDALHIDEPLIDAPQRERFARLGELLGGETPPGTEARVVPSLVTAEPEQAARFQVEVLAAGHEGLMAKALESAYEAGSRGFSWLKLKPAQTLDLVVLAAEWGSGRRKGFLSNLHLGARDPASGGFVMLGKTFKGLTDETLRWQTERLLALAIAREEHVVHVAPQLVVEIAFSDLQLSPRYPAGLALRFARVKRYRADKGPDGADTIETVRQLYEQKTGEPAPRRGPEAGA